MLPAKTVIINFHIGIILATIFLSHTSLAIHSSCYIKITFQFTVTHSVATLRLFCWLDHFSYFYCQIADSAVKNCLITQNMCGHCNSFILLFVFFFFYVTKLVLSIICRQSLTHERVVILSVPCDVQVKQIPVLCLHIHF